MFVTNYSVKELFINKNSLIKLGSTIGCIAILCSGCSSLGGGSNTKRAAKLSLGIQKAYAVETNTANRIAPLIITNAQQYQIDPLLLAALIRQESSYRNNVISPAGAVGLTQIMPKYWQNICAGDLFDEATNIHCGSYVLAKYKQSSGSWKKALAYYNVGPTGYDSNWKMKHQGKKYTKQVKSHQATLKRAL